MTTNAERLTSNLRGILDGLLGAPDGVTQNMILLVIGDLSRCNFNSGEKSSFKILQAASANWIIDLQDAHLVRCGDLLNLDGFDKTYCAVMDLEQLIYARTH